MTSLNGTESSTGLSLRADNTIENPTLRHPAGGQSFAERLMQHLQTMKQLKLAQDVSTDGPKPPADSSDPKVAQPVRRKTAPSAEEYAKYGFGAFFDPPLRCFHAPPKDTPATTPAPERPSTPPPKQSQPTVTTPGKFRVFSPPASPAASREVRPAWPPAPRGIPAFHDYYETFPPVIDLNDDSDSDSEYELDPEEELVSQMQDVRLQEEDELSDDEDCSCCRPTEPLMSTA